MKCSGKLPFSEYLGFQRYALEFSMCQMLGITCGTRITYKMMEGKTGLRGIIPRKDLKEWACLQRGGPFRANSWFRI